MNGLQVICECREGVCISMHHLSSVHCSAGPCIPQEHAGAGKWLVSGDDDNGSSIVSTVIYCQETPWGKGHLFRHQIKAEHTQTHTSCSSLHLARSFFKRIYTHKGMYIWMVKEKGSSQDYKNYSECYFTHKQYLCGRMTRETWESAVCPDIICGKSMATSSVEKAKCWLMNSNHYKGSLRMVTCSSFLLFWCRMLPFLWK